MHQTLCFFRFWLLLIRSAFQSDVEDQVYSSQPCWHLLLRKAWKRWEGEKRGGQEVGVRSHAQPFGWALKHQPAKEPFTPLYHRAVKDSSQKWRENGKELLCSLENIFTGEWRKKKHSINPKQFPSICQHMVGAIIIWLKYKVSSSLFFYFNSLTFLLWNLGVILWTSLSFSIVPWWNF